MAAGKDEARLLIDGQLVAAASGKTFDNINPATEEVIGQAPDGGKEDMHRAIAAARRAFDETDWSTNHKFRQQMLRQLHEAVMSEVEEIRQEIVTEVGAPISLTYGPQLDSPLSEGFLWPADYIDRFEWERALPDGHAFGSTSKRWVWKEAVGVVGSIIPWNFPWEITINKLAQVLATGNTTIVKPAPDTPFSGTRLARLIAEKTDIPAGVVNIVTTSDNTVAEELVIDPRVDMISFTGSTAVGRRIMEKGAANLKRVFLELGGKSANIYLDDADLPALLPFGGMMCIHGGQGCAIPTRILLPRSRYDEGVELLTEAFRNVPYGDPTDPKNIQGPQINARQRERVLGYIQKGVEEGARLAVGGGRPSHLSKGFFVEPTLFVDVRNDMTIAREEIFGPVGVVIPFEDDDDAVRIANDNIYGLAGSVNSADPERAMRVARRLRTGGVGVNGGAAYGADAPFGGYKASGIGRQNGHEGFLQYLETKTVALGSRE